MFSQWATKRVCKFFLKRLLGRILIGDLDLDNLDVQLASGTIQLKDLSLNTNYINDQLGDSSFIVKEGSIGSVTVKIPWKVMVAEPCEVELDELELVVTPHDAIDAGEAGALDTDSAVDIGHRELEHFDEEADKSGSVGAGGFSYLGVDDGVRMIARMVERVLLDLRVKVRNLVILIGNSLDTSFSLGGPSKEHTIGNASHGMLVFHVAHLDYGFDTHFSQNEAAADSLMEPAAITKVVNFTGVSAKFTDVALEDLQFEVSQACSSPSQVGEFLSDCVTILEGENGGASGTVQLTIPWRNDHQNVPKVEVGVSISPLNFRVSLNELHHLIALACSYESRGNAGTPVTGMRDVKSSGQSIFLSPDLANSRSNELGSVTCTNVYKSFEALSITSDTKRSDPSAFSTTAFLPVTKFISDWMQWTSNDTPQDLEVTEADLAASVDEFFDCLDGTRSSFASGSGVWSWTRSAFGSITAASSLEGESVSGRSDVRRDVEYNVQSKVDRFSLTYVCKREIQIRESNEEQYPKDEPEESFELCLEKINSFIQVAECETRFNLNIKSVVLRETVTAQKFHSKARDHGKHSCTEGAHWTRFATESLSTSMDKFLTPFPVSLDGLKLSECTTTGESRCCGSNMMKVLNFENLDESVKVKRGIVLLHISAIEEFATSLSIKWRSSFSGECAVDGIKRNHTDLSAALQPLIVWIDVRSLKKINLLISEIGALSSSHVTDKSRTDHSTTMKVPGDNIPICSYLNAGVVLPCVRMFLSFPRDETETSNCICFRKEFLVLNLTSSATSASNLQPVCTYKHSDRLQNGSALFEADSLMLNIQDVEVCVISEAGSDTCTGKPKFCCKRILQICQFPQNLMSVPKYDDLKESNKVDVKWQRKAGRASWILKRAWDEVAAQQRRGDGGGGVGGSSSEFAAATASEPVGEGKSHLQEQILQTSSMCVLVFLKDVKIIIPETYHMLLPELVACFSKSLFLNETPADFKRSTKVNDSVSNPSSCANSDVAQTSISVSCDTFEMIMHPQPLLESDMTGQISKDEWRFWDTLKFKFQNLQTLVGLALGGDLGANYLKLHHEDCQVAALSSNASESMTNVKNELLLLSCRGDVIGRGDGRGANALATGAAGLTVNAIVWPAKEQSTDTLVAGTMKGGTLVAHGGRLDWLPAVVTYFTECKNCASLHYMKPMTASSSCSSIENNVSEKENLELGGASCQRTYLLLDLHDTAVCYVPGTEGSASQGKDSKGHPRNCDFSSSTDSSDMGRESTPFPGSVACILAAAAVRVSSNVITNTGGVQFDIKLRDLALHLLDTGLRNHISFDYTTKSMQNAGYVQVANEAVMKAFVRVNCKEGPDWEVEFVNNQLHFSTCQDTTAAFGRLIIQLQQLFTPEVQQSSVHLRNRETGSGEVSEIHYKATQELSAIGSQQTSKSEDVSYDPDEMAGGSCFALFDGVLENAYNLVKNPKATARNLGMDLGVSNTSSQSVPNKESVNSESPGGSEETDFSALKTSSSVDTISSKLVKDFADSDRLEKSISVFIEDYCASGKQCLVRSDGSTSEKQSAKSSAQFFGSRRFQNQQNLEMDGGWYDNQTFELLDNHVSEDIVSEHTRQLKARADSRHYRVGGMAQLKPSNSNKYPTAVGRVLLRDLNARWKLYGGSDWPLGNLKMPSTSKQSRQGRRQESCVEVILDGMDLQYDAFPAKGVYASKLLVEIRNVRVYDCSVNAPWRLVLGYYRSSSYPRETSSKAVKIEMDSVRPNPESPLEEYRLLLSLLPIRLHLDQQHIDFFIDFFSQDTCLAGCQCQTSTDGTFLSGTASTELETTDEALLPFFQMCEIRPFMIRVDYLPRRLDLAALRGGNYAELLNLVSWKGIELQLKQVRAAGIHGWGSLSGVVFGEWLQDISQNQIHKFIKGLGPVRPFYALGSGAAKLIVIPAKQYKKDRRLLRGMKKGAITFFRSLSLEALGLGAHLAAGAHQILLQTELALGGLCSPESLAPDTWEELQREALQPSGTREGLQQAYESFSRGLERTASSLLGNPLKIYQRGAGAGLAVVSALKAAPAAALAPASAAAGAVHQALIGVRNGLDPEHKRESDEKHAGPPPEVKRCK
ncbi:hypothetical protein O6H91_08G051700 [Diphasiastrum complanatum]|uniref:Uncharacterized protein n=3 Tax=Diphasiastrum complanatum TaxID=34168 RepID=A0ACC2CXU9_DIPCM|nr:hypothetical protein O6H91_08G051700 [Diphasiastrum complanatum]